VDSSARAPGGAGTTCAAPPPSFVGEVVPSSDGGAVGRLAPALELRRLGYRLRERADIVALVMITGVAAGVRFATLGLQGLDHDEATTAFGVLQPTLGGTLSAVVHLERTPPLYYALAWLWTRPLGLGTGQVDLRALSAIFGTLTVPVVHLAARELVSRRAGVVTAALVALNPFLVWYSQEARAYALLVLFIALGLYLFARVLRDPSGRNLGLWACASILALCTHYFSAFMIVPETLWLLAVMRPRRRLLPSLGAIAAAGLALLPLAIAQEGTGETDWFSATPVLSRAWQIPVHYAAGVKPEILSPHDWLAALQISAAAVEIALLVAAVAILARWGRRRERRGALLASGLAAAAFLVPVAMAAAGIDYVDARNLIGTLVPLLVAAGIAFGVMRARIAGAIAVAVACALFAAVLILGSLTPQMQRPDWRGDAAAIGTSPTKRIVVVPRSAGPPISYYLGARQADGDGHPVWIRERDVDHAIRVPAPRAGLAQLGSNRADDRPGCQRPRHPAAHERGAPPAGVVVPGP
jgi:mannosyltransferase